MESFAPLLTLLLIYFLFALPVRKLTRAARKQQSARKPAAPAVPDDAFPEPDAPPAGEALSGGSGSLPYPEGGELRSARPSVRLSGRDDSLYAGSLNAVTGEGEDPCHEEQLQPLTRAEAAVPSPEAVPGLRLSWTGSDIVHGFVMGEILKRKSF